MTTYVRSDGTSPDTQYLNISTELSIPNPFGSTPYKVPLDFPLPVPVAGSLPFTCEKELTNQVLNFVTLLDTAKDKLPKELQGIDFRKVGLDVNTFNTFCTQSITNLAEPPLKSGINQAISFLPDNVINAIKGSSPTFYDFLLNDPSIKFVIQNLTKLGIENAVNVIQNKPATTSAAQTAKNASIDLIRSLCPTDGCSLKDFYSVPCRILDKNIIQRYTASTSPKLKSLLIGTDQLTTNPNLRAGPNQLLIKNICNEAVLGAQTALNSLGLSKYPACRYKEKDNDGLPVYTPKTIPNPGADPVNNTITNKPCYSTVDRRVEQ